jgi:hypothetical protein
MPENDITIPTSDLLPFGQWLREMHKTSSTGWRFRQRGWIETVNICGRLYVSRSAILRFEARAAAGDFARVHKTPARTERVA